jgi:hypothetical protein
MAGTGSILAGIGAKTFGVLSVVGVGISSSALVIGLLVITGAAGIHGLNGTPGANGANGVNGNDGQNGAQGPAGGSGSSGSNGTQGSSTATTWGTISLSFQLGDKAAGVSLLGATCPSEGHGAYACLVTLQNDNPAGINDTVHGLSYAQSPALYFAGGNPTIGSINLPGGGTTTQFTLWFQAVQYSGSANVVVTILLVPAPTTA